MNGMRVPPLAREELQQVTVREFRRYFEIAAELNLAAHSYIVEFEAARLEPQALPLAILCRGTNSLQGAVVLCEVRLTAEANSLVRASLECCFALGALRQDYPLLEKLQVSHEAARGRWARFQLHNSGESRLGEKDLERLQTQLIETPAGDGLNYWNLAHQAGLMEYYETMYRPLSNFGTHLSEGSLSALLEPAANDSQHIRMALHSALSTYILLLREASRFHPVAAIDAVVAPLTHRFADLIQKDGS